MDRTYGIQTLLMTDVVGSTRLWASQPAAMPTAVERLEALAQAAILSEGGELVRARGEGDSLFCLFSHPAAAARAATALVRGLRASLGGLSLQVRVAIHCGPAQARGTDLYGTVPNRCARLREIAYPDQVLLSGAARSQIVAEDALALRDLGRHRLRDLDEPESVWQLLGEGLPEVFPPLRSLSALRNNLPLQPTSFVGREILRRDLIGRFAADRLTTLTGAGGCGKTRLSLQLGADAIEAFPDGVWFVELAEAATEPAVVRAVADACGQRDLPEAGGVPALVERLRGAGQVLFVLDNAEQALGPIGRVVGGLMAGLPDARFLVTSREPLRLRGERVHRVPPLSVPPALCADPAAVVATEAGALFLDRARLRRPDFELGPSGAAPVTEIVRRLDGIPLCLEMAASHVDYLGVDQIAARLNDRFALLEGDDADAPPRHRTMRETIAWQYDTLAQEEQVLLQRLAAFAGSFDLEAAEAVGGPVRPLRALVEKSLVVAVPDGATMRYRLLETIAQFASERHEGGAEAAMDALVDWAVDGAQKGYTGLHSSTHAETLSLVEKAEPSIRKALERCFANRDARGAILCLAMTRYWYFKGRYREARDRLERAFVLHTDVRQRFRFINALAVFCGVLGDHAAAAANLENALSDPSLEDEVRLFMLANLGFSLIETGRKAASMEAYERALSLATSSGNESMARDCRYNIAVVLMDIGRIEEANAALVEVARQYEAASDTPLEAKCYAALADRQALDGNLDLAASWLTRALTPGTESEAQHLLDVLGTAASIALSRGSFSEAAFLDGGMMNVQQEMNAQLPGRKVRQIDSFRAALDGLRDERIALSRSRGRGATIERLIEACWRQADETNRGQH